MLRSALRCGLVALFIAVPVQAQFGGGGGFGGGGIGGMGGGGGGGFGQGGGGQGGFGGGMGGMGGQGGGGVVIDPKGVIRDLGKRKSNDLTPVRIPDALKGQAARRISLKAVARELDQFLAKKSPKETIPEELLRLAGLCRIEFVLVEGDDVVLIGPAEEWARHPDGRMLGATSRRPAIELADLAVALRTVLNGEGKITCTIEPTKEGLASYRSFKMPETDGSPKSIAEVRKKLAQAVGLQKVETTGLPADTRFALAVVDADYLMKQLAHGHDRVSYLKSPLDERSGEVGKGFNRAQFKRWWFTAADQAVERNSDGTVYRFVGPGMKLHAEAMAIAEDGSTTGEGDVADAYSKSFNANLSKLEARYPAFADLHNLYDVALAAAIIKHKGAPTWLSNSALLDAKRFPTSVGAAPKLAEPIVNFKFAGGSVMMATGGVEIAPDRQLSASSVAADNLAAPKADVDPAGRFWSSTPKTP
jgi:hypothetical protein